MQLAPQSLVIFCLLLLPPWAAGLPQHGLRSRALLLHVQQGVHTRPATPVSLSDTSDALGGILDAVSTSFAAYRGALSAIDAGCQAQAGVAVSRVQEQGNVISGLQSKVVLNGAISAGLQAELEHLERTETEARASYDAAVSQRAMEAQTFADGLATGLQQEHVISDVLTHLEQKRVIISPSFDVGAANTTAYRAPSSSVSQLDYIIGVFKTLLSTTQNDHVQDAASHAAQDAHMSQLVGSYRTALQHVDEQHQAKMVERAEAHSLATRAAQAVGLRQAGVHADEQAIALMVMLCGSSGGGGEVHRAASAGEQEMQSLQTRVEELLLSMDEIAAQDAAAAQAATAQATATAENSSATAEENATAENSSASQLLLGRRRMVKDGASAESKATDFLQLARSERTGVTTLGNAPGLSQLPRLPSRASRWLAAARARGLRPLFTPPRFARRGPAASAENAVQELRAGRSAIGPAAGVLGPTTVSAVLHGRSTPAASTEGTLSAEREQCVLQKQQLTAQIVAARQATRESKEKAVVANARVVAIMDLALVLSEQRAASRMAQDALSTTWIPPVHLQLGHNLSYNSAVAACSAQSGNLCRSGEVCPFGGLTNGPVGEPLAGDHWVPIADAENNWIHIGNSGSQPCALQHADGTGASQWGMSSIVAEVKDHVYCCHTRPPLGSAADFATVLADALVGLSSVEANLTAYAQASTLPAATALPDALTRIRSAVAALKLETPQDADRLTKLYNDLQMVHTTTTSLIDNNASTLEAEGMAANQEWSAAENRVHSQEAREQELVAQRAVVEAQCEAWHATAVAGNVSAVTGNVPSAAGNATAAAGNNLVEAGNATITTSAPAR